MIHLESWLVTLSFSDSQNLTEVFESALVCHALPIVVAVLTYEERDVENWLCSF